MDRTDAELLDASRRADRAAFRELVERCARMVDAVSYAATRDRTLSEDITQDTFLAAWRALDRLRDPAALRPWLCRIARNLAHKARRRQKHEVALADPDTHRSDHTPFDAMRDGEAERALATALDGVPEVYRETLVLFYFEERSAKDVAVALGVTEQVVFKRLSRGRQFLAAGFEEQLKPRRSRRELSACVLALLPTKGPSMWNSKLAGVVAATVAIVTVAVLPRSDARPSKPAPAARHPTPHAATRAPALPTPPQAATCVAAARHIVDVALTNLESATEGREARIDHVTDRLERECRDERWSQAQIDCVLAADVPRATDRCRPKAPRPAAVPPVVGTSCDVAARHVADLMLASMDDTHGDNVAALVVEDTDGLPGRVKASCIDDEWSEPLRRCYAAATRMDQIVVCNIQLR